MELSKANLHYIMYVCNSYFPNNGFTLSNQKSAVVIFSRHRIVKEHTICLNRCTIPWVFSIKYLGVYLDQKLSWDEHINYLANKAEKGLNVLRAVVSRSWGSDPKTSLIFYKSFTRSILDVGSIFYGSASNTRLKKLDRIQYKALRLVTGAFRSSPIQALLA